jgi:tetraacyldisaccharide 4'-kinase
MELLRLLLIPLGALYGFAVWFRNKFYDWGILSSVSFPLPVIAVGNLAAGGTGKTPAIEYLVRLLSSQYKVAIISRGYKRKTRGFLLATPENTYEDIGDEPLQYVKKFPGVLVAVDEKRKNGIQQILDDHPDTQVILLDDAFQHRKVQAGLSILLTDYHSLYCNDHLLPAGYLREPVSGARRADAIVVTKTPRIFSPIIRRQILEDLKPQANQPVFFSYVYNEALVPLFDSEPLSIENASVKSVFLLTGIVNTAPIEDYLRTRCNELILVSYPDHHEYTMDELEDLKQRFIDLHTKAKVIITTEKDAMRLADNEVSWLFKDIPFYYLPGAIEFHKEDKNAFNSMIIDYVKKATGND